MRQGGRMDRMESVSRGRAAALVALGAGALMFLCGPPTWSDAWQCGAPLRAALCALAGVCVLAAHRLYRLLFCPLVLLRKLEDVGFLAEDGRSKAQTANEIRRRMRTGDLPPVYPNGWYRLLDSSMLGQGQVKNVTALGEQLAVFRGHDGKAYVVDAYCPHLGANLAVGGKVVGNCIECPFHGWRFSGRDGRCVKIPYAAKVPEVAKVRCWPSCEVNHQILLWFHCDGEAPQWSVPKHPEVTEGRWVYRGRSEHFINSHIQEIPENIGDLAHFNYLHNPGFISGSDLRYTFSKIFAFLQHRWKAEWEAETEPNKHCCQMFMKHKVTVFGRHLSVFDWDVVARQFGPGLVWIEFGHGFMGRGVLIQCVTPVEPLLQCVTHTIFYQSNMPTLMPKIFLKVECIQFERDIMIWNNKKYISKPLLVKEDATLQKHRRWFSQFYSDNSPRLRHRRDTLDF